MNYLTNLKDRITYDKKAQLVTHGIVHAGFSGLRRFVARKKGRCKLTGNRFVIPHDTIPSNVTSNYSMRQQYDIEWLTDKFENGDSLKFLYFWGHTKKYEQDVGNFCFSQWFESSFKINGLTYKTTEHWMMAQKALLFDNKEIFEKIVNSDKPGEVKELGRQVIGFDENIWIENRFEIVRLGNIHKFNQNRDLGDYLLKTGNRILVEASPVDTIWGIGLTKDSNEIDNLYAWRGLNLLGFALMETRDFLNDFGFFTDLKCDLIAPWIKYPDIDDKDMFWKMGKGEQFMIEFSQTYNKLTDKEKIIFKLTNPEPYDWKGFYD